MAKQKMHYSVAGMSELAESIRTVAKRVDRLGEKMTKRGLVTIYADHEQKQAKAFELWDIWIKAANGLIAATAAQSEDEDDDDGEKEQPPPKTPKRKGA